MRNPKYECLLTTGLSSYHRYFWCVRLSLLPSLKRCKHLPPRPPLTRDIEPQSRGISHFSPYKIFLPLFFRRFRRFCEVKFLTGQLFDQVWEFFAGKRLDRIGWNLVGRKRVPQTTKYIFYKKSYRLDFSQLMFENWKKFKISKSHRGVPWQATPTKFGGPLEVVTLDPKVKKLGPAHFRFVP